MSKVTSKNLVQVFEYGSGEDAFKSVV